jgi:squalene-hopene/tetraprenyl-beta-curcumene cyclase
MAMRKSAICLSTAALCLFSAVIVAWSQSGTLWSPRAAASYLDSRQNWWMAWSNAKRDHDTSCISCHTSLPYALARPTLRGIIGERDLSPAEQGLLRNVTKRVRLWKEVEPFYPDQTVGLPKTSESRGVEAVMNALILATQDASKGALTDETRQAFSNMWELQFKTGDLKGGWAWLSFGLEPWESQGGPYFGAALAAFAVGNAPDGYAATPGIQERLKALGDFLQRRMEKESLFNRAMALWGSQKFPEMLTTNQRQSIIEALIRAQQNDGGWSMSSLGTWKRSDGTPLDASSDAYATGLIALVLQQSGKESARVPAERALSWLSRHQDPTTGAWTASSLNKQRDAGSDIAKFMNDSATAYAVLALAQAPRQ